MTGLTPALGPNFKDRSLFRLPFELRVASRLMFRQFGATRYEGVGVC